MEVGDPAPLAIACIGNDYISIPEWEKPGYTRCTWWEADRGFYLVIDDLNQVVARKGISWHIVVAEP